MSVDPAVAPDGSPVELYLRLSGGDPGRLIAAAIEPSSRVLDLGCGVGRVAVELIAAGHRVTGVDESPEMLSHAEARGLEVVRADLVGLDLGRRFDVVLLLSHLINEAEPAVRSAFWAVAAAHVVPGGMVIVERHHPDWVRQAEPSVSTVDGVEIELHDVEHLAPDRMRARVTYRIEGRAFTQPFEVLALDARALADEAAVEGLALERWLDDAAELGLLRARP